MLGLDQVTAASNESDGTSAGPDTAVPADPTRAPSAGTPAELVTAMRALKEWTGLTYRQLQRRAAASGAVLPHSTIAAVLTRTTLPREDLLATFVRACGGDDAAVESWLTTRRRIAVAATRSGPDNTGTPSQPAAPEPDAATSAQSADPVPPAVEPDRNSAVPDREPTVPDRDSAVPDREPVVSDREPTAPDREPVVSDRNSAAPDRDSTVPDREPAALPAGAGAAGLLNDPPTDPEPDAPAAARAVPDVDSSGPATAPTDAAWEAAIGTGTGSDPSALTSATAEQRQWRWKGIHRHDPADEVPRPKGLRWLVPPIMYRTGWAARVLSGVLVLLLVLIAVAFTVRLMRDRGGSPAVDPNRSDVVVETEDADPQQPPSQSPPTTRPKPPRTSTPGKGQPSAGVVPPLAPAAPAASTGSAGQAGPTAPPTAPAAPTSAPRSSRHPDPGSGSTTYSCDTNGCNPFLGTSDPWGQPAPGNTSDCQYPCVVITKLD
ncbi:helix-turn-helix domain-containing protein [Micromonospora eburnea]|uniref:Helix-turn-helix domain-containing protein n=1 Tax=Micromonospora eburnea TaxID=227316 RepID=A0A1C6TVI9_9ACTN|nr:helix-turn-helix transcriptional regulator [Micromonospora eburnea]SCL45689.1 hypothetical protein GA0070604_1070 [Micromonospora eburnea]